MQFVKVTNAELLHLHLHPGSRNITNDKKMNFFCFIVLTYFHKESTGDPNCWKNTEVTAEQRSTMDYGYQGKYLPTYSDNQHLFLEILFRPQQEVRIRLLREESYFLSDQESVPESNCNEWKDV